jgi:hypothetical protein
MLILAANNGCNMSYNSSKKMIMTTSENALRIATKDRLKP